MNDIIDQIAKKRGVSPDYVRQETNKVLDEMWNAGVLHGIFPQKPTVEQFIYMFAFFISESLSVK